MAECPTQVKEGHGFRRSSTEAAASGIEQALVGEAGRPVIKPFFDEASNTCSYVIHDPEKLEAAIIDSVLDFDLSSAGLIRIQPTP